MAYPSWLWIAAICLLLNAFYTWSVTHYLDRVSAISLSPNSSTGEESKIGLSIATDGLTWLRLIKEKHLDSVGADPHYTFTDNFSKGRAVHWSSLWSNYLYYLAKLRMLITEEPLSSALETSSRWANFPLWTFTVLFFGAWIARRWGSSAALVFSLGMLGHPGLYLGYYPAYPDHHGLIASCIIGLLIGAIDMISGYANNYGNRSGEPYNKARLAIILSAVFGGIGMAISAASLIPMIILTGLTGTALHLRDLKHPELAKSEKSNVAALWSLWGQVGAATCLLLYFLEYLPGPYSLRLEINHPLYALAWLGGGEIIARFIEWKYHGFNRNSVLKGGLAILLLTLPLFLYFYLGSSVFAPADPFLSRVHKEISEFRPFWKESATFKAIYLLTLAPLLAAFFNTPRNTIDSCYKLKSCFMVVTLATSALALYQERWWLLAGAAQIIQSVLLTRNFRLTSRRTYFTWMFFVCLMYLPGIFLLAWERVSVERISDVQKGEAMQLIYRDVAKTINSRNSGSKIALLAPPNASVGIGYYGNIPTIGTLYWENSEGLHAAAEILSSEENNAAEALIKKQGVSYLVMVTPEDFTVEYMRALGIITTPERIKRSFGRRLMTGENVPKWLEAVPYQLPPTYAKMQARVYIYEVKWDQNEADSKWAFALTRIFAGEETLGRNALAASANAGKAEAGMILAWRLATSPNTETRDGLSAVPWAESSIKLLAEKAANRRILAAAYAAARRWSEAQAACLYAIDLAKEENDHELMMHLEREFTLYQNEQSFQ